MIGSGHPAFQRLLLKTHKLHIRPRKAALRTALDNWIARDIILDSPPLTREVEIFELQRKSNAGEWEPYLFTATHYTPLSIQRLSNASLKGARFFEDVVAPAGWEWQGKKWELDLWPKEWVEERGITCVEVEMAGERWVWDLVYEGNEDVESLFGGSAGSSRPGSSATVGGSPQKTRTKMGLGKIEGEIGNGKRGEWRRRRWVRMVVRRDMN